MPCDTVQTMTVQSELANRNIDLLKAALQSMGFTVNQKAGGFLTFYGNHNATGQYHAGVYQNGKLTEQVAQGGKALEVNAIKRSYAAQIVQKGFPGWTLTKTTPKQQMGVIS